MNNDDGDLSRFKREVEELVERWSGGDVRKSVRLWMRLHSWSLKRLGKHTPAKRKLKRELLQERGATCEECGGAKSPQELHMHRLDAQHADDSDRDFGYFAENVKLLCARCHIPTETGAER